MIKLLITIDIIEAMIAVLIIKTTEQYGDQP